MVAEPMVSVLVLPDERRTTRRSKKQLYISNITALQMYQTKGI